MRYSENYPGVVLAVLPSMYVLTKMHWCWQVIDYTQEDFTQNGQSYDLILADNGFFYLYWESIKDLKRKQENILPFIVITVGSLIVISILPSLSTKIGPVLEGSL